MYGAQANQVVYGMENEKMQGTVTQYSVKRDQNSL